MSISIRQLTRVNPLALMVVVSCTIAFGGHARAQSTPISLHPDNPRYLFWRGKPTVLITSGEHYGAVMNKPFDYIAYLDALQSLGFNLTRVFSGLYCEKVGDFGIANNTLAPTEGTLICPFARSDMPGYANGGNKFDLTSWDEAYFDRLKDFVAAAGKRGIVVEYTFFCPYYAPSMWSLSPFNPENNVNSIDLQQPPVKPYRAFGLGYLVHPALFPFQKKFIRKVVTELKNADNLYYEICNEAYGVPSKWQHEITQVIVGVENELSCKHLIAQNTHPVYEDVHPGVSIYNYHPLAVVVEMKKDWRLVLQEGYSKNKLAALDETGPSGGPPGSGTPSFDYRCWGWVNLLGGGAIYNNRLVGIIRG